VKGVDEDGHVTKLVCDDLAWMGHTKVISKCDNEPAIKNVPTESITKMKVGVEDLETISKEHPERYESQPNGMTEMGVKNFRGHFRTLWSCIRRRLGVVIPINHPVAAWLVGHVRLLMNTMVRGGWPHGVGESTRKAVPTTADRILRVLHVQTAREGTSA
jgi:hypothetical protein